MIRIFKLVVLLVISQVGFGQAPSNYTNINGRYRWIAGMFDSTFHIPKGSTPSLRTGGSTNSGGLFYNTSDSSVYTYTGTQWIKLRGSINPSDTTNKYVTQVYKKSGSDSIFYVKGGTHTWAFNDSTGSPGGGGGGKIYYFNGGVSMGTISGLQMYELGDTANTGTAANFTRSTTGNIANFITDSGKPGLLQIPAGVWSVDAWLSETGGGANHAEIWIEVEKWDGSTITTIATSPIEQITEGATPNLYSWSVSIPTTSLTVTDRIIIQFYISNTNGKTVTLYTQNGYVGEVHTTFTTGIGAINGLTAPAQYLVTGTSGVDFNISSATATHTFNLPTASSMIRGALSPTDWSAFNNKIGPSDTASMLSPYLRSNVAAATYVPYTGATTNVNLGVRTLTASGLYIANTNALFGRNAANNSDYSLIGITGGDKVYIDAGNLGTTIGGPLTLATLNNATVDTDAFLVSDGGVVKYRTGTQLLSDIGAASSSSISGTTNYIPKFTSSSAIGNSVIYESSSNIGIGTTAPSGKLDVFSAGDVYQNIYTSGSGTSSVLSMYNSSGTTDGAAIGYNTAMRFGTITGLNASGFSEKMRLNSSGNLGLGVTPSAWNSGIKVQQIGYSAFILGSGSEQAIIGSNWYQNTSAANVYLNNGFATFYQQVSGTHQFFTAPSGTAGNAISFTQAMTLDASGNLGIGSTSPTDRLHAAAPTAAGLSLQATGTGGATWRILSTDNAASISGGKLGFNNGSYRMVIDGSGNVGIGTTSPANLLSLVQSNSASSTTLDITNSSNASTTTKTAQLLFRISDIANDIKPAASIIAYPDGVNNISSGMYFSTRSGDGGPFERMRITSGGNVGIGTSSPSNKLSVINAVAGSEVARFTDANNADLVLSFPSAGVAAIDFEYGAAGSLAFRSGTGKNERMRITSAGEVLIATTTDAGNYKLQVSGDVYATAYFESSDLRLKNVLYERQGSDGINTINFKWKDGRDNLTHIGYAAQQVEKVLPDAVKTNPDGYKTVNYDEVQTLKIANLEQEVKELKALINKLMDKK